MATTGRNRRLEPSFKQHTAVDDLSGVVLDVTVTTGEVNEGQVLESQIDAVAALTGEAIPDGHDGRRLRLRQDLRRARTTQDRGPDPGQGRADPKPGAASPLPLRCPARHRQMP
jgi:hypothetical protein